MYFDGAGLRMVVADRFGRCSSAEPVEIPWQSGGFSSALQALPSGLPRVARLVLAETYVYTLTVALPKKTPTDRESVGRYVRETVPERSEDILWDYSLAKRSLLPGGKPETYAHYVAIRKELLETLIRPLQAAGFMMETIDAESCALARPLKREPEPLIVGEGGREGATTLVAVYQGLPLASEIIASGSEETAARFPVSVAKRYGIPFRKAVLSLRVSGTVAVALSDAGLTVERRESDLCLGVMVKSVLRGKDEIVLNIARLSEVRKDRGILKK